MNESPEILTPGSLPRPGEVALLTAIDAVLEVPGRASCRAGSRWSGVTSERRSRRFPAPAASRSRWSRRCSSATPAAKCRPMPAITSAEQRPRTQRCTASTHDVFGS